MTPTLFGHVLRKLRIFQEIQNAGFDYIINPETGELHKAIGGTLSGSHNLVTADIANFIGISNMGSIPIHWKFDGTTIPIYDLVTNTLLGSYALNKCKHCYPGLH
jgi:hypothetical protein